MEYVIAALLLMGSILIAILPNLIANELYDCAPSFARWLIGRALARLPESERERCREEWYADNDGWPGGKLGKVKHAIGCWLGVRAVARVLVRPSSKAGRHVEPSKDVKNQNLSAYANVREGWDLAFEDELEEAKNFISLSRQDRARRAEYYQNLRDRFFTRLEQMSDYYNSDGDLIDAFLQWRAHRNRSNGDEEE